MSILENLPHLLRLLDDDSPIVRQAIVSEIAALGPELDDALKRIEPRPTPEEIERLNLLRGSIHRTRICGTWRSWMLVRAETWSLEAAMAILVEFQGGQARELPLLLDELADGFRATGVKSDCFELAQYLFRHERFEGAKSDYYSPLNSNLVHCIRERRGIPISLTCIYMLVGFRLDIEIHGCNFPGHFLARAELGNETVLVDCFNGGRLIEAKSFFNLNPTAPSERDELLNTTTAMIVSRVLNNLSNAYSLAGDSIHSNFMLELLHMLRMEID